MNRTCKFGATPGWSF